MDHKKHSLIILGCCVLFLVAVIAVNFAMDPLQFFGRNPSIGFYNDQRFQNSGFIRSYLDDRDAIFIGTSLSENFTPTGRYGAHEVRGLRLVISGGSWMEHEIICTSALATGRVKKVFWELRSSTYQEESPAFSTTKGFPGNLYEADRPVLVRAASYLINPTISGLSMELISKGRFNDATLESYHQWMNDHVEKGRFLLNNGAESMAKYLEVVEAARARVSRAAEKVPSFKSIDRVAALIAAHPDVRFNLFLPPVSMANSLAERRPETYAPYLRHVVALMDRFPNARLYCFVTLRGVVDNCANYEDSGHYGQAINDMILRNMLEGRFEVTASNVEDYVDAFYEMASGWPFYSDFSRATAYRPEQWDLLLGAAERMGGEFERMLDGTRGAGLLKPGAFRASASDAGTAVGTLPVAGKSQIEKDGTEVPSP